MRFSTSCLLCVTLAVTVASGVFGGGIPSSLDYSPGDELTFKVSSVVDTRGFDGSSTTGGSFAQLDATAAIRCQSVQKIKSTSSEKSKISVPVISKNGTSHGNATSPSANEEDGYLFVMNLFGTTVGAGETENEPPHGKATVMGGEKGQSTSDSSSLGEDMYFLQSASGQIIRVWYSTSDSPYFVNVKLGVINAFQTKVTSPGSAVSITETDVVGTHISKYTASASSSSSSSSASPSNPAAVLTASKTFSQSDFSAFADPTVNSHTFEITAGSSLSLAADGKPVSALVDQTALFVDALTGETGTIERKTTGDSSSSAAGFNMNLRAAGKLTLSRSSSSSSSDANSGSSMFGKAKKGGKKSLYTSSTALDHKSNIRGGSLLSVATALIRGSAVSSVGGGRGEVGDKKGGKKGHSTNSASEIAKIAFRALTAAEIKEASKKVTSGNGEGVSSSDLGARAIVIGRLRRLVKALRETPSETVRVLRPYCGKLVGSRSSKLLSLRSKVLYVLSSLGTVPAERLLVASGLKSKSASTRAHAVMAASALVDPSYRIVDALSGLATDDSDETVRNSALAALGTVLTRCSDVPRVQQGAALLARLLEFALSRKDMPAADAVLKAIDNAGTDLVPLSDLPAQVLNDPELSAIVKGKLAGLAGVGDPFPYNKTFSSSLPVGGKIIGADFSAQLFAGTNFDCKHKSFNYEGLARANATLWLFGHEQTAFDAVAVYGQANGSPEPNEVSLKVWDKVVYERKLPTVGQCKQEDIPIAHASPGFDVKHTLWVSVIPVTFEAAVSLDLKLDWGWKICPSKLSASVELTPDAAIVVTGSATLDLLIIRAGASIDAAFNTKVKPEAQALGTLCEIELDATKTNVPMAAAFDAFYQVHKCRLWIFDCHWEQPVDRTIWSWSAPSKTTTLFKKTWKIAKPPSMIIQK